MTPYYSDAAIELYQGDALDVLRQLPTASVHALVSDPPAGISFMGKDWDGNRGGRSQWVAAMAAIFAECLRVLKPGAHGLVWALPRTAHWTALALEDAGFEVRDCLTHLFGQGFPKSLDVSKAIDKRGGNPHLAGEIGQALKAARQRRGLTATEADRLFCGGTTNWSWFEGRSTGQRAPTPDTFAKIAKAWPEVAYLAALVDEAEREVTGKAQWNNSKHHFLPGEDHTQRVHLDLTAPATPEAQQWDGWGTALKPGAEMWWLVRKPFKGNVAANVLEHGTGAINVDGCRIATDESIACHRNTAQNDVYGTFNEAYQPGDHGKFTHTKGRWPANVILDEDAAAALDAASGERKSGAWNGKRNTPKTKNAYGEYESRHEAGKPADIGGPSRYFYVAKPSQAERNQYLEGRNHHPTVKSVALMRWLARLITPPNGVILDPFIGSGSTAVAAQVEGFRCIGIDLSSDYLDLAIKRTAQKSLWFNEREVV